MGERMALALLSESLWLWTLLLFPSNLSFRQQQQRPSSVLGEKGTSVSQGEKICLSLFATALGPDIMLLQQCTLTASTGSALHCPEGKQAGKTSLQHSQDKTTPLRAGMAVWPVLLPPAPHTSVCPAMGRTHIAWAGSDVAGRGCPWAPAGRKHDVMWQCTQPALCAGPRMGFTSSAWEASTMAHSQGNWSWEIKSGLLWAGANSLLQEE